MKARLRCLPCYVSQSLQASRYAGMDEEGRWRTVRAVCQALSGVERSTSSARIGQLVHKVVRDHAEVSDPYREKKESSNARARAYLDEFRELTRESDEPLERAARLAAAGNAIDFGPDRDFDIESELKRGFREEFAVNDWPDFASRLEDAADLLYFSDNSGEIIYDRLFIELLLDRTELEAVDLVVKDGPFLNDVTERDLQDLEVPDLNGVGVRTVDNGDGGSSPPLWSEEVESWLDEYDLVVSKGQANYEGLSEHGSENLFYFLTVKCELISEAAGAEKGSKVLIRSGG